ncbi:hypothetical protein SNEBB_004139 [Seison nebaliae]|nr:hypothetical protein SNEBB_004139 [Seison nebaliae]
MTHDSSIFIDIILPNQSSLIYDTALITAIAIFILITLYCVASLVKVLVNMRAEEYLNELYEDIGHITEKSNNYHIYIHDRSNEIDEISNFLSYFAALVLLFSCICLLIQLVQCYVRGEERILIIQHEEMERLREQSLRARTADYRVEKEGRRRY